MVDLWCDSKCCATTCHIDFCARLEVLPYGPKAAQHYGSIRRALAKQGQPIGINDLHIAAHARSEGLALVSNNLRE